MKYKFAIGQLWDHISPFDMNGWNSIPPDAYNNKHLVLHYGTVVYEIQGLIHDIVWPEGCAVVKCIKDSYDLDFVGKVKELPLRFFSEYPYRLIWPNPNLSLQSGANCSKCRTHYPMAATNQPDGSFKCWACRNGY